jgi:hypothetical protein
MKKTLTQLTLITLALAVALIFGPMGNYSVSGQSKPRSSGKTTSPIESAPVQEASITLPRRNIYGLNADNTIFVLSPGSTGFRRLVSVTEVDGNLIGIDFRPADESATSIYGLTNTGKLYTINVGSSELGATTLVSTLSTRFAGGFQSLMDFNPVLNALRLIGTNDQNFALVNSGGNLNVTAVQTAMSYAPGDVNAGVDPNVTGGAYNNNFVGAASTLFYGIDYNLGTFVTIAPPLSATGSSNTGGGQLQTIGRITNAKGNPLNFSPTTDLDIYSEDGGVNILIGISGRTIFTINLSQINKSLPLGATQRVVARGITLRETGGNFIDIAISPFAQ